ncbi:uncharacterized protein LOC125377519 [Haliotis rufescens]|uniref:uncharacterized protein LOC124119852 n=1 Tax=Haliotis rufescens TaxID=6454 RepID=UPI001EB080F6|nr:uncharacterized protein LOC124119852 [Haliotis rufescens]XP_048247132.1 uncharacterized protein LOC125377519 [Haliotis rufescens]
MKFVMCVAAALLSSVSGLEWPTRRETLPDRSDECQNVFAQILGILQRPRFSNLIEDGRLSLDCSQQTLTTADECQRSGSGRVERLNIALNIFCSHKPEIEREASCWTSGELSETVVSCLHQDRRAVAECADQNVSNLRECTNTTGAIFRQLILDTFP